MRLRTGRFINHGETTPSLLLKSFLKIGRTFKTVQERMEPIPYNYQVLHTVHSSDGHKICKLERQLHRENAHRSYTPKQPFGGSTECFNLTNGERSERV